MSLEFKKTRVELGAIFIILLVFSQAVAKADSDWITRLRSKEGINRVNDIVVLQSAREEVDRVFKNRYRRKNSGIFYDDYITKFGDVYFKYNTIECQANGMKKIPPNTVEEVMVFLDEAFELDDLALPLKDFVVEPENDTFRYELINDEYGITIGVDGNSPAHLVDFVRYFPPSKLNYKCPDEQARISSGLMR